MSVGKSIPFWLIHIAAVVGVAALGWSWWGFGIALAAYYVRMFGVTAGYHRYFSHRTFRTSRVGQFLLAVLAMSSSQKGVLWWASHHRVHHLKSDQPGDVHSVRLDGFWWSHVGWVLADDWEETELSRVRDLAKYPELRFLDRNWALVPTAYAVASFLLGGWFGLVWAFLVSTTLLWHGTFTINSLCHVFGSRRFATTDDSKNNFWLALVTLGEGWHNNHHHYFRSANQGFYWWEVDPTFYVLRALERLGVVWDVHVAPEAVRGDEDERNAPVLTAPPSPVSAAARGQSTVPAPATVAVSGMDAVGGMDAPAAE
jgi:stearoyl-CoA desaturase (delta-9 desaturase)